MSTVKSPTSMSGRVVPVVLSAVVMAIVLGILGMHTLTSHSVMTGAVHHTGTAQMKTTASALTDTSVGSLGGADSAYGVPLLAGSVGAVSIPGGEGGHDMPGMAMLCVFMLLAAGLVLPVALVMRRASRVWACLAAVPTVAHAFTLGRLAKGPPYVWEFSVIRC